jgi:hypothetical protein
VFIIAVIAIPAAHAQQASSNSNSSYLGHKINQTQERTLFSALQNMRN